MTDLVTAAGSDGQQVTFDSWQRRAEVRAAVGCPACHALRGQPCRNEVNSGQHSARITRWEKRQ